MKIRKRFTAIIERMRFWRGPKKELPASSRDSASAVLEDLTDDSVATETLSTVASAATDVDAPDLPIHIRFEASLYHRLRDHLLKSQQDDEDFCFVFCNTVRTSNAIFVLPRKIVAFAGDDTAVSRSRARVRVSADLVNEAYSMALAEEFDTILDCHSHPFDQGQVAFSPIDDASERIHAPYVEQELSHASVKLGKPPRKLLYLAIVFGPNTFAARHYNVKHGCFDPIAKVTVLSDPIQVFTSSSSGTPTAPPDSFDRQVRAFGKEGQFILSRLKVVVVGAGGIGSIVTEALARLGIAKMVVIDMDTVETTNLNRLQGATPDDVGRKKVSVVARQARAANPDVEVNEIDQDLFHPDIVDAIKDADCIIGGLDNAPARYFLNRLAAQYLIPLIDGGTGITKTEAGQAQLRCRTAVVMPGLTPCMCCSPIQYFEQRELVMAFADARTRDQLEQHGYIQAGEAPAAPAVYPLNLGVASLITTTFMALFTGVSPRYWTTTIDYSGLEHDQRIGLDMATNLEGPSDQCLICGCYLGEGDRESLASYFKAADDRELSLDLEPAHVT